MAGKRGFDLEDSPPLSTSKAAGFNAHVLKKLQAAVTEDPEINLTEQFPTEYAKRLLEMQKTSHRLPKKTKPNPQDLPKADEDIRQSLCPLDPVEVIFPLSDVVAKLLETVPRTAECSPVVGLSQQLSELLQRSEIIWKAPFARQKGVFKCSLGVVVKAVRNLKHYTEYTTLQYLDRHKPSIPAPKPLGLVRMSGISLIFMSHMQSVPLGEVWRTLIPSQKTSLSNQLNTILADLRTLPYLEGTPLGGIGGEGCTDLRRHVRTSETPITSLDDFETFLFSSSHPGGDVFVKFLRRLSSSFLTRPGPRIVFTHGDIRPDNVMVQMTENNKYTISGILDWEYSGFYPDYYECVRCTNCLSPYEEDDWFLYLPKYVSPNSYPEWWLLDRVRETRVV
ncbi:uncharacterized protein N7500_008932 [Penicillium coprophilum]|uniref:uncharacterized protein n=1 Tax=Penicillium coprophilum TaxID=36646 RepID=UPI002389A25B|nr:uncharacterized protein N7500_008932 [Penicillium coprophilum]KAJ5159281.1 hypothetical protein N7500_008932 [Penicillium coprophilum]